MAENTIDTTGTTEGKDEWIKSSYSSGAGQCVEMRAIPGGVQIRDSKNPAGPVLENITTPELAAWIDGAKNGEFDHLV